MRLISPVLLALMVLVGGPVRAAEPIHAFEPEGTVVDLNRGLAPEELYYHPSDELFYGENWHFMARLDQGWVIYSNVLITNMGLSQPSCAVEFSILGADGRKYTSKLEYGKEDISASTTSYSIKVAGNVIGGEYPSYRLHLAQEGMEIDLSYRNLLPGWKFNSGVVYFGEDRAKYWKYQITSPSAAVEGTLKFGGKVIEVKGFGFQDHSLMNIPATSFSRRWVHFRQFGDGEAVIATEVMTSEDYDTPRIVLVMVGKAGKIVYQGDKLDLDMKDPIMDDEYGYAYPQKLSLKVEDKGFSLSGEVTVKRLLERIVVLSHLNPVLRGLVHAFIAKPVYYRCLESYDLTLTAGDQTARLSGDALGEVVFIK